MNHKTHKTHRKHSSPRRGLYILAQGRAKRRQPRSAALGHQDHENQALKGRHNSERDSFRPFRAPFGGNPVHPGRRCALPWAYLFRPLRGEFCGGSLGASSVPSVHGVA